MPAQGYDSSEIKKYWGSLGQAGESELWEFSLLIPYIWGAKWLEFPNHTIVEGIAAPLLSSPQNV